MIERVFRDWKSSLVAFIIIATCLLLVMFKVATFSQVWPGAIGILGFFFKDENPFKKKRQRLNDDDDVFNSKYD